MAKRSKQIQLTVDRINTILALKTVCISEYDAQGTMSLKYYTSDTPEAYAYKQGLVDAIESILHASNSYKGYVYLDGTTCVSPSMEPRKYDRRYI
jgi:hypothetical protein